MWALPPEDVLEVDHTKDREKHVFTVLSGIRRCFVVEWPPVGKSLN
jgi:hypothetical protein